MNYQEWIKTDSYQNDELTDMVMVNRNQERYSQMTPFGVKIWTDYRSTMNPFKEPMEWFTLYDLNLSFDKYERAVIQMNGKMEVFYSEDGFGTPVFDKEEDAYNFLSWYTENKTEKLNTIKVVV